MWSHAVDLQTGGQELKHNFRVVFLVVGFFFFFVKAGEVNSLSLMPSRCLNSSGDVKEGGRRKSLKTT